jgi:hypothetical protein
MTPASDRRKADTWRRVGLWALGALLALFTWEARRVENAVFDGQARIAANEARVANLEYRVGTVEGNLYNHVSAKK